jgi:hypothetical protein
LGIIFAIDRRDRYVWDKRIYRPVPRGETRLAYYWWELRRWLTE